MPKLIITLILVVQAFSLSAQGQERTLRVAFYNVENLCDTLDNPNKADDAYTPTGSMKWNTVLLEDKINKLAQVIGAMFGDEFPDVLGLCEVENPAITRSLAEHKSLKKAGYEVVQLESSDSRGMDVAFVYNSKKVQVLQYFTDALYQKSDTTMSGRDILWVQTVCDLEDTIWFSVNHWPSRLGGDKKTSPKRVVAAKVLRSRTDSLLNLNEMTKIVLMGDFNDEPSDSSMNYYLGAKDFSDKGPLFNTMISLQKGGLGSYHYRNKWQMTDQFVLSKGIVGATKGYIYEPNSAQVFSETWMTEAGSGKPFRTFAGKKYLGGYSDHFPITIILKARN